MPENVINLIRKRDGRLQDFQDKRIADAISKAFAAVGDPDPNKAAEVCRRVVSVLSIFYHGDRIDDEEDGSLKGRWLQMEHLCGGGRCFGFSHFPM